jgi:hypothetical protein
MRNNKLDQLIHQMENYLECWKQFNQFINIARARKFSAEEETQFLEVKSVLVQELELVTSAVEITSPSKEEVHTLIGTAPSLRYLSEMNDGQLRSLENSWHKIYIGWHSILGQLKVKQREEESKSAFASFFGDKKKK